MKETRYLELLKEEKYEELKTMFEKTISNNSALKTNSKSRVSAINKLIKYNESFGRNNLIGCGKSENGYCFTDSYIAFELIDNVEKEINESFPDLKRIMSDFIDNKEELFIDTDTLNYYVKIKENYNNDYFNEYSFDYKKLDILLKVMGKGKIYTDYKKRSIIIINDKNEVGLLLGIKLYK